MLPFMSRVPEVKCDVLCCVEGCVSLAQGGEGLVVRNIKETPVSRYVTKHFQGI